MKELNLKQYLEKNILLFDGAMGTYYASQTNDTDLCEWANIRHPQIIEDIHKAYILAGAKIIRTNTFAANRYDMDCSVEEVNQVIQRGYEIACRVAHETDTFVACSIGPISEFESTDTGMILEEYFRVIDVFLDLKAQIFLFETFPNTEYIERFVGYILDRNPEAQIIGLFTVNMQGYSKTGMNYKKIIETVKSVEGLTAFGLNCGTGAGHLSQLISSIDLEDYDFAAIPNAGYPERILDRTLYIDNTEYFADTIMDICKLGVNIIGGCCGTTPEHIRKIHQGLIMLDKQQINKKVILTKENMVQQKRENKFLNKLENNEFVIAVELDPPYGYDISKFMDAAHILKAQGVDILTIADSPMGKMRLDALMMSTKIYREVGIDVMPHVCCRDKNIIALKSLISAAYVEGIRNFLLVTGDPLPDTLRSEIKSVFNMNSIKLMGLVEKMNEEIPGEDGFIYGGALNPKGVNLDKIIERVDQKKAHGAGYLLTQPIFTEEDIEKLRIIKERTGIKILGGILPLVSYKNARFINNEFAGMNIPDDIVNRFNSNMTREEAEAVGIEISVEIGKKLREKVDGLYFMTPFNRATMITKILKSL